MLLHEDLEMEEAALSGEFDVCVPVSVWQAYDANEPEITAYSNVWDICERYEKTCGANPFDTDAIAELESEIIPIMQELGYETDTKNNRVIREYRISDVTPVISDCAKGAVIVRSTEEIKDLQCLCLHEPEPDDTDDTDVCAVVVCDGRICAVAGVNDLFTDDTVEIYVETAKDYRRRGFGAAAVAALIEYLTGLGCTVGYKCGSDNTASVGIAEKLGMTFDGRRYDMVFYAKQ